MLKMRAPRIKKKLMAGFNDHGYDILCLTDNLSKYGMCILSDITFPDQKEIVLSLAAPSEIYDIKCKVVWYKNPEEIDYTHGATGIEITEAPSGYLNYVEYLDHCQD